LLRLLKPPTPSGPITRLSPHGSEQPAQERPVELGASDIHLKIGQPPILRRDGDLDPMEGFPRRSRSRTSPEILQIVGGPRAREASALRRLRRSRHRLPRRGSASLPRQRLPAAWRHLIRLPRHPQDRARLRAAQPAARRPEARRVAPRARARHRRDRLGKDDDPRGDDRLHETAGRKQATSSRSRTRSRSCTPITARSSTSARSGSIPSRSARRCAVRSGRTPTRF